jgi:hypothetical protein
MASVCSESRGASNNGIWGPVVATIFFSCLGQEDHVKHQQKYPNV